MNPITEEWTEIASYAQHGWLKRWNECGINSGTSRRQVEHLETMKKESNVSAHCIASTVLTFVLVMLYVPPREHPLFCLKIGSE